MYIYGGYVPGKAQYSRNIYALDLDKMEWNTVFLSKKGADEPEGISNFQIVKQKKQMGKYNHKMNK